MTTTDQNDAHLIDGQIQALEEGIIRKAFEDANQLNTILIKNRHAAMPEVRQMHFTTMEVIAFIQFRKGYRAAQAEAEKHKAEAAKYRGMVEWIGENMTPFSFPVRGQDHKWWVRKSTGSTSTPVNYLRGDPYPDFESALIAAMEVNG